ncbi:prepilin-type N-terminal cleavage/methylation domain-containing protein [Metabacillus idriensis]|uniref:prepilin-type N-terminal cleavage/methylation domain-containing protein n=1 Tax=Metabacillus idriensis TaxID=324768 RepID=UPI003D2C4E0D
MSNNERGVTLIELLLVLVLSSMVLTLSASFLFTMFKTSDQTLLETELRNESVLILDSLNKAMENADGLLLSEGASEIVKKVNVSQINIIDENGVFKENPITFIIEIKNGNLLINNNIVNHPNFSMADSVFYQKENKLVCKIIIKEKNTPSKPYELIKIYELK